MIFCFVPYVEALCHIRWIKFEIFLMYTMFINRSNVQSTLYINPNLKPLHEKLLL